MASIGTSKMAYTMVIQACQLNTSIALHPFSPFSLQKSKLGTSFFPILHEIFKEEEATIFIFFQAPSYCFDFFSQSLGKKPLNLSFPSNFFLIFMKNSYLRFQIYFSSFGSLRLQHLSFFSLTILWKLHSR